MEWNSPKLLIFAIVGGVCPLLMPSCGCKDTTPHSIVTNGVVVSVRDQKLAIMRNGKAVRTYSVSTSKFGLGDRKGSNKTPIGQHSIAAKVGDNQPKGMVFKSCRPTGEVVTPNSPGRDPIVTRILCLRGEEPWNKNAFSRRIYIHGTAEERTIGSPSSYGCIRMKSDDILDLYPSVSRGEPVAIELCSIEASEEAAARYLSPKAGEMPLASHQVVATMDSNQATPEATAAAIAPVTQKPKAASSPKAKKTPVYLARTSSSRYSAKARGKRKKGGSNNSLVYSGKERTRNRG